MVAYYEAQTSHPPANFLPAIAKSRSFRRVRVVPSSNTSTGSLPSTARVVDRLPLLRSCVDLREQFLNPLRCLDILVLCSALRSSIEVAPAFVELLASRHQRFDEIEV